MDEHRFLVGLLGGGIGSSWGPALQEAEAQAQGLALTYRLVDSQVHRYGEHDLAAALGWAVRFGFDGLNVTHPFKLAVVPLLDDLTPEARLLGAVNTLTIHDGRTLGHNTDWLGFDGALRATLPTVVGQPVAVIGAGGAGLAIAYALLRAGSSVHVFDIDPARSTALVERLADAGDVRVAPTLDVALRGVAGVVNATPIGMTDHPGQPIPPHWLTPERWFGDAVYFPPETALVQAARVAGCQVLPGHIMAVHQHAAAFALFTGRRADVSRMATQAHRLLTTEPPSPSPKPTLR